MAHAATISTLADGLIASITSWTPEKDSRRLRQARDAATRAFRSQQHPRVNQYDIQARLEGLEEKFIVLNRDPLADALHSRLEELATQSSKWTPEILALLLNLSDRPAEKTDLSSLNNHDESPESVPQLTWAEIIADDPLTEEGIWDDVVIDSDYSDNDFESVLDGTSTGHVLFTQASSLGEDDIAAFAKSFLVTKKDSALNDVEATRAHLRLPRYGKEAPSSVEITEFQAIREALSMMKGLPTSLFDVRSDKQVRPRPCFFVCGCEASTFQRVLGELARLGSQINNLRASALSGSGGQLLQRLKAAVQVKLRSMDSELTTMEQHFLSPHSEVVVSIQDVYHSIRRLSNSLLHLAAAIFSSESKTESWAILDSLFDMSCDLQLCGNTADFLCIASIFFECLDVYLRPIHVWMVQGKLQDPDGTLFVQSTNQDVDLGDLWRTRFILAKHPDGTIDAPSFMQYAANQVFIAGKNVMFLEALKYDSATEVFDRVQVSDFGSASILESHDSLLPFAGVFDAELQRWIGGLQSHSMHSLREVMFSQCGLGDVLDVVSHLFLAKEGATFQHFADELFARIDRNRSWSDRFVLTDLAKSTLGLLRSVDSGRMSVRLSQRPSNGGSSGLPNEDLCRIRIDYTVSWPVRNVIGDFDICQRAFTTSLRVYRAEYLLTKQQWEVQAAKKSRNQQTRAALALRQRLVWFTSICRGYTSETTEITMRNLRADLATAPNLDGMTLAYANFQNSLEAKLLLRKNLRPIFMSLLGLLDICEDFAVLWTQFVESDSKDIITATSTASSRKARADRLLDDSDDEFEEEQENRPRAVADTSTLSKEYERQIHFLVAGLRGVSRVDGEPAWISFAERLQMGLDYAGAG